MVSISAWRDLKLSGPATRPGDREMMNEGSGFRVQGSGFRVQGSGFKVKQSLRLLPAEPAY
jgi:hypothetical protein